MNLAIGALSGVFNGPLLTCWEGAKKAYRKLRYH